MDKVFANVECKLKAWAKVNFVCGIIPATCLPFCAAFAGDGLVFFLGLLVGCGYLLGALIASWLLYAFAELVENTKQVNRILKIRFVGDVTNAAEQKEQAEWVQIKALQKGQVARSNVEAAYKKRQEEAALRHTEPLRGRAKDKLSRIADYWDEHPEELQALAEQRTAAKEKLEDVKISATERQELEDLIQSIDEELNKDRDE